MKEWSEVLYYKINKPVLNLCLRTGITPNQITIFNHLLTLTLGLWAFSRGNWGANALGLGVLLLNGYLDYLDGDVAKIGGKASEIGAWLDSGFDVVIQNAVMAAIAMGCFRYGLPLWIVALFFVGNSACNLVSFQFNSVFKFSSHRGNEKFRLWMDRRPSLFNSFMKNIIDPTASKIGLVLFTVRYFIIAGVIFNLMPLCFLTITIITNIRWFIMYVLYAFYLKDYEWLWVLKCLRALDDERQEYYEIIKEA